MNKSSVSDCVLIHLPQLGEGNGHITAVNNAIEIPFDINRVFYLYNIPGGELRGAHAHKECYQFLVAAIGSFEVLIDDGTTRKQIQLNGPNIGLYIPPGIWASELNFSSGSICLVLASEKFTEQDYIRDYKQYLEYINIT